MEEEWMGEGRGEAGAGERKGGRGNHDNKKLINKKRKKWIRKTICGRRERENFKTFSKLDRPELGGW